MKVNTFDQPAVEQVKVLTKKFLKLKIVQQKKFVSVHKSDFSIIFILLLKIFHLFFSMKNTNMF